MTFLHLEKRFASSQGEIAYDSFGAGPDLVLVHGTPANALVWSGVVARLKDRFRLHLLDLPGYGASAKYDGQDVRLRSFARVLAEWLDALGLKAPALIGHDFGAATVLGAHLVEGVEARAVGVIDGVTLSPWGTPFSRHVQANEAVFAAVPGYVHEAMLRAHLKTATSRLLDEETMRMLVAPWLGAAGQSAYFRQIGQYDYGYTDELEQLYPTMRAPARVFWGAEDRWLDPAMGARLAALIPGAELTLLPDCGHFAMLDAPGLLCREIEAWLASAGRD